MTAVFAGPSGTGKTLAARLVAGELGLPLYAVNLAANLKGRLMLYYGTADNNVHPNNMMQLVTALQKAGKSFEMQVGPDQGHSGVNGQRMMEFFIENLVLNKEPRLERPQ